MTIDRPHCPPISRTDDRTWMQVIELFKQNGMAEPPVRLRDELVMVLEWAWYGHAIATTKPVAEAVKVKPLEWNPIEADTPIGRFRVSLRPMANGLFGAWFGPHPIGEFDTRNDAKAAAQADYEARIMSALSTPPQPETQEPVAWRWRDNEYQSWNFIDFDPIHMDYVHVEPLYAAALSTASEPKP